MRERSERAVNVQLNILPAGGRQDVEGGAAGVVDSLVTGFAAAMAEGGGRDRDMVGEGAVGGGAGGGEVEGGVKHSAYVCVWEGWWWEGEKRSASWFVVIFMSHVY